mmetsp:Transcript_108099/g.247903  ORF Transcript_108099/g.247903 Transcript_108099/m.247903 type:complete len:167 (-) Transcript_108099:416-916(-)
MRLKAWYSSLPRDTPYFRKHSFRKPKCSFMVVSSWLPRFKYTHLGSNNFSMNSNTKISIEFFPRSTTSPLNKYTLLLDGRPFLKKNPQHIFNLSVGVTDYHHPATLRNRKLDQSLGPLHFGPPVFEQFLDIIIWHKSLTRLQLVQDLVNCFLRGKHSIAELLKLNP